MSDITDADIRKARELVEAHLVETFAPEEVPEHNAYSIWQMPTASGWQMLFVTGLRDTKRLVITYTEATDTITLEVVLDGKPEVR